jgi:hypothetical protein
MSVGIGPREPGMMDSVSELIERAERLAERFGSAQSELRVKKLEHAMGDLCDAVISTVSVNEALKSETATLICKNDQITRVLSTLVSAIETSQVMPLFGDLCEQFENLNLSIKDAGVSEMQSEMEEKPRLAVISDRGREPAEGPNEYLAFDISKTVEIPAVELPTELRRVPVD